MIEKQTIENIWVPKQIADLWTTMDASSFEYYLLDNLRAAVEAIIDYVRFAEKYKTYNDYRVWLTKAGALTGSEIDDTIESDKKNKVLEDGQKYLSKGVTSKVLLKAKAILEKCLETE